VAALISKPGITRASTSSGVPKEWSQNWFRDFVSDHLKLADVRNAVGSGGISITGNLTSYATIGLTTLAGATQIISSTTAETRSNTATPSNSSVLQLTLTPGTYRVEWAVSIKQAAAGAVGVNYNVNFSGSYSNLGAAIGFGGGVSPTTAQFFGTGSIVAAPTQTAFSAAQVDTFGDVFFGFGYIKVTTTGTLALAFAQNTSSATVITLASAAGLPGCLTATRIA
jgi:hypothetical protein